MNTSAHDLTRSSTLPEITVVAMRASCIRVYSTADWEVVPAAYSRINSICPGNTMAGLIEQLYAV